jgi:hypothetical protein
MKLFYGLLLSGTLALPILAQSQQPNNYVANVANASAPGQNNTLVGSFAGASLAEGNANVFVGYGAGYFTSTGSSNSYLGTSAGVYYENASQNTFLGCRAGLGFGLRPGSGVTAGSANTFVGYQAGYNNTTGQFNTFMGVNAGFSNTAGNSNFMLGTNAGSRNTSGTANFFVGDNAGAANTTGGFNVFLGTNAGAGNTVGNNNTAIGFEANVSSGNLVNATAIGFRAVASANNSLVLGNGANVGIGTSSPTAKLEVVSSTSNTSGLKLTSLTSSSQPTLSGQTKFLTVDGSGNVVLGSTTSGGRLAADLWQQKGQYLQNVSGNGVVIGEEVNKTPAGYRLYVQDGILTEKVKVAVKNTSEWSDYVFTPSYKLTPLAEVARFIEVNKHLPGVPSAAEVVAQGVDVAKMDAKLLEKIEELTLYSIQQQTTVEKQQQEIDELKKQNAKIVELEKLVKQLLDRK